MVELRGMCTKSQSARSIDKEGSIPERNPRTLDLAKPITKWRDGCVGVRRDRRTTSDLKTPWDPTKQDQRPRGRGGRYRIEFPGDADQFCEERLLRLRKVILEELGRRVGHLNGARANNGKTRHRSHILLTQVPTKFVCPASFLTFGDHP